MRRSFSTSGPGPGDRRRPDRSGRPEDDGQGNRPRPCRPASTPHRRRTASRARTRISRRSATTFKAHYLDSDAETAVKQAFGKKGEEPEFLIVCDKLLTGFDAPIESVMYLDKPLKEHGLLQAIARTNRVADAKKRNGLIVDYIGVSVKPGGGSRILSGRRCAERDAEPRRSPKPASGRPRRRRSHDEGPEAGMLASSEGRLKAEFDASSSLLKTEDKWFEFRGKAREFIGLTKPSVRIPRAGIHR